MARTAYEADRDIERSLFADDQDFDLFSASQITDILAKDFEDLAIEHARFYMAE